MQSLDLFGGAAAPTVDLYAGADVALPPLREYQQRAVDAVRVEHESVDGTLVLLATGTGKTQIAAELIRTEPGRCCFIAHRGELIKQAAKRIEQFTGIYPQIEQAQNRAGTYDNSTVVASIQTLSRESRISRFDPNEFSLIVIDEVHHATSATYRAVIEYFSGAKIVGLTATPDRLDGQALGQIMGSVAYRYDLMDAIDDGWLAPIKMRTVQVDGVDFSKVKTVAGDFNQGDLDAVMSREESLHGVAKPTVELAGDRPTIVFTTSIDNAHRLAEVIDRYAGREAAVAIDSKLPPEQRAENMRLYESGERQFLVNVGIATEGYDHPPTACIALARPTKSRAMYVQMLGRGTRGGANFPIEGKHDCLALDFQGMSGQHDIITAVDALGGDISEEEAHLLKDELERAESSMSIEEAKEKAAATMLKMQERIDAEKQKRAHIQGRVTYRDYDPNPYVALNAKRDYLHERYGHAAATDAQMAALRKMTGKNANALPENLGKQEASRLLGKMVERSKKGMCTFNQMAALKKRGVAAENFTFQGASRVLDGIAKNGWKPLAPDVVARLAVGE